MNTYSRVHTNLDAIDNNGIRAEVKVQSGCANIISIEPSGSGKAYNVTVQVDGAQYKMNGWVPADDPVYSKVLEAKEANEPIEFRIESIRKRNVDRTIPMKELTKDATTAKDNINKALAAVKRLNDTNWTFSPKMKTRMEEDPNDMQDPNSMSLDDFTGGTTKTVAATNVDNEPAGIEAPPYKTHNNDGQLNPGSYAAAVPINILTYVMTSDTKEGLELSETEKATLAKVIIEMANELQNYMYNYELDKPLFNANSHTRARAIVFQVIDNYFNMGKDVVANKESLEKWKNNILKKAKGLWDWNIKETDKYI